MKYLTLSTLTELIIPSYCWERSGESRTLYTVYEYVPWYNGTTTLENSSFNSLKTLSIPIISSEHPTSRCLPKRNKSKYTCNDLYTNVHSKIISNSKN